MIMTLLWLIAKFSLNFFFNFFQAGNGEKVELLLNRTSETCDIYVNGILNATTGHSSPVNVSLDEMHLFSNGTDHKTIIIAVSSGLNLIVSHDYNIVREACGKRLSIYNNICSEPILITHINITVIGGLFICFLPVKVGECVPSKVTKQTRERLDRNYIPLTPCKCSTT